MAKDLYEQLLDIEDQLNRAKATPGKFRNAEQREHCYSLIAAAKICLLVAIDIAGLTREDDA